MSELVREAESGSRPPSPAEADSSRPASGKPGEAETWTDEVRRVGAQIGVGNLNVTRLTPGWEADGGFDRLRVERDRLLVIKNGLGFLSADAAARFDRRLAAASEIIDTETSGHAGRAAVKLSQAEHVLQLAWWSVRWNRWKPWIGLPLWMWVTGPLAAALGGTVFVIFNAQLYPDGEDVALPTALFGAALWGLAGALANGLRTVHLRVQAQEFARDRVAWYGLSPILGLAFGAIVFLLFIGGLLSTGQNLETGGSAAVVNPTPIFLLAVLAGFAQNAFIGALQQIIKAQFRGASPEDEIPV